MVILLGMKMKTRFIEASLGLRVGTAQ